MQNLALLRLSSCKPKEGLSNPACFCVESRGKSYTIYAVVRGSLVAINGDHLEEILFETSLSDAGHADATIVGIEFVLEHDAVCLASKSGDVLLCHCSSKEFECVGCVDSGIRTMAWSPDQELVAFVTGNMSVLLMTKDFDLLTETPIHGKDFGQDSFVAVGWGSKETQFHGSDGKPKRLNPTPEGVSPAFSWDDGVPRVSWRGDGQYFVCSALSPDTGARKLRVWNRDGILQSTSEDVSGLEQALNWRPSGSLIASTQRKPHRHDVVFFERNGLKHGEFSLPFGKRQVKVREVQWNNSSSVLALLLEEFPSDDDNDSSSSVSKSYIQLWHSNNYHWYLKQEKRYFRSSVAFLLWDPEIPYRLHVMTSDGGLFCYEFSWTTNQSGGIAATNSCTVAVIDGAQLLLTPFKYRVVPPPIAAQTVKLPTPINQITFGPSGSVLALLSDGRLALLSQKDGAAELTDTRKIDFDAGIVEALRHVVWWKESTVFAVAWLPDDRADFLFEIIALSKEDGKFAPQMRKRFALRLPALQMYANADTTSLLVEYVDGSVDVYSGGDSGVFCPWKNSSGTPIAFPHPCSQIATAIFKNEEVPVGLSEWHRFYIESNEIARDCTSFAIHSEFLLLTTNRHTCTFLPLQCTVKEIESMVSGDQLSSENVRRVERGSRIVTVEPCGSRLVFQMPRGNLETIHPRPLVLSAVRKYLDSLEFGKAFQMMKKHRINMNLIYDHNPESFSKNVDVFVSQLDSPTSISLFLSDLKAEDVTQAMYPGWQKKESGRSRISCDKVNDVCRLVINAMEKVDGKKYVLSILTAHIKKSGPELEEALLKVKSLRDESCGPVTADEAMKYLVVLVDVNRLYDVALGTYDLNLVLMVAEKSQKDPKEYLPFLNQFRKMTNYDKYRIDRHLKRYRKALEHISECGPERFSVCLELVKECRLYPEALRLFDGRKEEAKAIALEYGAHLETERKYDEAGLVLTRYEHLREALAAFQKAGAWRHCFCLTARLQCSKLETVEIAKNLSGYLRNHRRHAEAAHLLEEYAEDYEEATAALIEGALWDEAMRLIYKYNRLDLLETNFRPTLVEACNSHLTDLSSLQDDFVRHATRLQVVRDEKLKRSEDGEDDFVVGRESDLYSDTSSVTGASVNTGSTKTSGRSRKSQRKAKSKKYRLKEGSPYEDIALLNVLGEIVRGVDTKKRDVSSLLRMLYLFGYDTEAVKLQRLLDGFLACVEERKAEIWCTENLKVTGPQSTVNSILLANERGRAGVQNATEEDVAVKMPELDKEPWQLSVCYAEM
ncbi:elongator complex protein 1-like isoform X2 [Oscarella lobularis]|uniref:elongator complex protein 1-like isoform X2 n=1 Tax=Oscarella lobularis TaxID=121494 RepID=UPI0033141F42